VLEVVTRPSGATVFLDGEKRFGETPLELHGVPTGKDLRLVVLHDDHEPHARTVRLDSQGKEGVTIELTPTENGGAPGSLAVQVDHGGAQVFLDGELQGAAPVKLDDVASGVEHSVVVTKDGFATETVELKLKPGEHRDLQVSLSPERSDLEGVDKPRRARGGPVEVPRARGRRLGGGRQGERLPDR
jgi:hypothetical protein